jgi:hypothetical protein
VVTYTNVPYEDTELASLELLTQVLEWSWGYKSLFTLGDFVTYILDRSKVKSALLCEARYKFVEKAVCSQYFPPETESIDDVMRLSL